MDKLQAFEDFLKEFHCEIERTVLDDDLPDAFETWISNKDVDDIISLANLYGKKCYLTGKEEIVREKAKRLGINI